MARIITRKVKERPKDTQPARTKEKKELIPLLVKKYFAHNPSIVTWMQIVKS
jgi:hypothetical protein